MDVTDTGQEPPTLEQKTQTDFWRDRQFCTAARLAAGVGRLLQRIPEERGRQTCQTLPSDQRLLLPSGRRLCAWGGRREGQGARGRSAGLGGVLHGEGGALFPPSLFLAQVLAQSRFSVVLGS